MSKRRQDQSQLDYLWETFGDISLIGNPFDASDGDILNKQGVSSLILNMTARLLKSLTTKDNEQDESLIDVYGTTNGKGDVFMFSFEKEDHATGLKIRMSTLDDVTAGLCKNENIPLLEIHMKRGSVHTVALSEVYYTGSRTGSINTIVEDGIIKSYLRLANSLDPVINVEITGGGLIIESIIGGSTGQVRLEKTQEGLSVKYAWNDGSDIKMKELNWAEYAIDQDDRKGIIYFLKDLGYISLNGVHYGEIPSNVIRFTEDPIDDNTDRKTIVLNPEDSISCMLDGQLVRFVKVDRNKTVAIGDQSIPLTLFGANGTIAYNSNVLAFKSELDKSVEDINSKFDNVPQYTEIDTQGVKRKIIQLANFDALFGTSTADNGISIATVNKQNEVELGSPSYPVSIKGSEGRPKYNSENLALIKDVNDLGIVNIGRLGSFGDVPSRLAEKSLCMNAKTKIITFIVSNSTYGDEAGVCMNIYSQGKAYQTLNWKNEVFERTLVDGDTIEVTDFVQVSRVFLSKKAVYGPKLFALTTDSSDADIKAALTSVVSGKQITSEDLDKCFVYGFQLKEEVMNGNVSVGWNGHAYTFYSFGYKNPKSPNTMSSVSIAANADGTFRVTVNGVSEKAIGSSTINDYLSDVVKFVSIDDGSVEGRKAIVLKNHWPILGGMLGDTGNAALIMLSKWGIVDIGSSACPINLNTPAGVRPTVQEAGQTGEEANKIAYVSDVEAIQNKLDGKVDLTDISTEDEPNRKAIVLKNNDILLGTDTNGATYNIGMINKWNVVDLGTNKLQINLNTPAGVRPTVQEAGQSGEEANHIAYYEDIDEKTRKSIASLPNHIVNGIEDSAQTRETDDGLLIYYGALYMAKGQNGTYAQSKMPKIASLKLPYASDSKSGIMKSEYVKTINDLTAKVSELTERLESSLSEIESLKARIESLEQKP